MELAIWIKKVFLIIAGSFTQGRDPCELAAGIVMAVSMLRSILSIILYILLFYSIFDVYYTSPLVHRGTYDRPSVPSLVKTVVFIVADGLRYDKLFTINMEDAPTLRYYPSVFLFETFIFSIKYAILCKTCVFVQNWRLFIVHLMNIPTQTGFPNSGLI